MNTETRQQIEALRTFAVAHHEIPFAHLCSAALNGEPWAVERLAPVLERFANSPSFAVTENEGNFKLEIVRSIDTTRPDGAVARSMQQPEWLRKKLGI